MDFNMKDNRQLLCTFSNIKDFDGAIEEIKKFYKIHNKIFVFSNVKNPKEVYITYNILNEDGKEFPKFKNTISIHRKKQTNTLYTLNAMNQVIRDENNGEFDKSFEVNWKLYENSLVITGDTGVRIIPLKICDIIS